MANEMKPKGMPNGPQPGMPEPPKKPNLGKDGKPLPPPNGPKPGDKNMPEPSKGPKK